MVDEYLNYADVPMPIGSGATHFYWGTGGNDTLVGGGPDDTFTIYSSSESIVEVPGVMATVVVSTWSPYQMPANVTNMTVSGAPGTVVGNGLANLIIAQGTAGMTIDGGGGNDVLVGNSGPDTFVVGPGYGHEVIYDFNAASDIIRLPGFGITSFATLQSSVSQKGLDVVITLDPNDSVTVRNTTVGQLSASNFELGLDTSHMTLTFDDEFNTFTSSPNGSKGWTTTYYYGDRTLPANHEAEYYSDSSVGVNPFSDSNGILTITAAPAAPGATPAGSGLTYTSGAITTQHSFSQLYGYFEVRAELPAGQGFWPAFWLLPANGTWPPELDVLEQIGSQPSTIFETSHSDVGGFNAQQGFATQVTTATTAFHTYGVDWEADKITWYIDGVSVASTPTPADMHTPMYMLLNLAVGQAGSWPGAADGTSSAQMLVDYVRAYSLPSVALPPPSVAITSQVLAQDTGASAGDGITSNGNVTLTGTASGQSGLAVVVYDGTTALGTATLNGTGGWTFSTKLGQGTHALSAVATDSTQNSSTTAVEPTITVLTATPAVAITSQTLAADTGASATDLVTSDGAVTLAGTVAGPSGTVVGIYDGKTQLGTATLNPNSTWTYTMTLAAGSHALHAVATDLAGNAGTSAVAAAITVATKAPSLAVTSAVQLANTETELLTGTVSGAVATTVSIYNGSTDLGVAIPDGKGGWTFTDNLVPGSYNLSAVATDLAGNTKTVHSKFTVTAPASIGSPALTVTTGTTLILDQVSENSAAVTFMGNNAMVQFKTAQDFFGTIKGFAASDTLDLRSIGFGGPVATSLAYAGHGGAGILTVSDGTHTANLSMLGRYAASNFQAASDHQGGTAITFVRG